MTIATATEQPPRERIAATMAELGLTIGSQFVPFSQSRNATPGPDGKVWKSLNWRVTLYKAATTRGGDADTRAILTTDYSAGIAACEAIKASLKTLGSHNSVMRDEAITAEIETGRKWSAFGVTRHKHEPDPVSVMASLVMDSDVIDASSFEEWASNCGYDTDSRKAETIYRACLDIALKLRNSIGEAGLQKLRDACQDY